jgi:hypothetical protein
MAQKTQEKATLDSLFSMRQFDANGRHEIVSFDFVPSCG